MKEHLGKLSEEQSLGDVTVEVVIGHVVRATPKSGGQTYVRLHLHHAAENYLWLGDPDHFDFETSNLDPELGNDWQREE